MTAVRLRTGVAICAAGCMLTLLCLRGTAQTETGPETRGARYQVGIFKTVTYVMDKNLSSHRDEEESLLRIDTWTGKVERYTHTVAARPAGSVADWGRWEPLEVNRVVGEPPR